MKFGFPPADTDVDECLLQVLGRLEKGCAVDIDYAFAAVAAMVNGDLTHGQLAGRILALRGGRRVIAFKDKVKGKSRSLYRLRTDTDNEKPEWPTPPSSR